LKNLLAGAAGTFLNFQRVKVPAAQNAILIKIRKIGLDWNYLSLKPNNCNWTNCNCCPEGR